MSQPSCKLYYQITYALLPWPLVRETAKANIQGNPDALHIDTSTPTNSQAPNFVPESPMTVITTALQSLASPQPTVTTHLMASSFVSPIAGVGVVGVGGAGGVAGMGAGAAANNGTSSSSGSMSVSTASPSLAPQLMRFANVEQLSSTFPPAQSSSTDIHVSNMGLTSPLAGQSDGVSATTPSSALQKAQAEREIAYIEGLRRNDGVYLTPAKNNTGKAVSWSINFMQPGSEKGAAQQGGAPADFRSNSGRKDKDSARRLSQTKTLPQPADMAGATPPRSFSPPGSRTISPSRRQADSRAGSPLRSQRVASVAE